jgi:hypothetical protein
VGKEPCGTEYCSGGGGLKGLGVLEARPSTPYLLNNKRNDGVVAIEPWSPLLFSPASLLFLPRLPVSVPVRRVGGGGCLKVDVKGVWEPACGTEVTTT